MDMQKLNAQRAEFDTLYQLAKSYNAMPAIVDDDYPEYRHYYERDLQAFIAALQANGRLKPSGPEGIVTLLKLATQIHADNVEKGFYEDASRNEPAVFLLARMALIHSEVSEATEFVRKPAQDDHLPQYSGIHCELADILIRVLDLAAYLKVDIDRVVQDKLAYNRTRPYKHAKSC